MWRANIYVAPMGLHVFWDNAYPALRTGLQTCHPSGVVYKTANIKMADLKTILLLIREIRFNSCNSWTLFVFAVKKGIIL